MFRPNPNGRPGECPTCSGKGVCPVCKGESARVTSYGKVYAKYPKRGRLDEATGKVMALTDAEFQSVNNPDNMPHCEACEDSDRCPQCGVTGKVWILN